MLSWLLGLALAASPPELVAVAADAERPEEERRAAFDRAVTEVPTEQLLALLRDREADPRQRWVAARLLGRQGGPRAVEALLELLDSPMPDMRVAALMALGDTLGFDVVEPVAARLEDPAVLVRGAAADALARMGDARALPALERALEDPSNFYRGSSLWVRRHMVDAVASIGGRDALPILVERLQDVDPEVVDASIRGLERMTGLSYAEGRSREEQVQAWTRWWARQGH